MIFKSIQKSFTLLVYRLPLLSRLTNLLHGSKREIHNHLNQSWLQTSLAIILRAKGPWYKLYYSFPLFPLLLRLRRKREESSTTQIKPPPIQHLENMQLDHLHQTSQANMGLSCIKISFLGDLLDNMHSPSLSMISIWHGSNTGLAGLTPPLKDLTCYSKAPMRTWLSLVTS